MLRSVGFQEITRYRVGLSRHSALSGIERHDVGSIEDEFTLVIEAKKITSFNRPQNSRGNPCRASGKILYYANNSYNNDSMILLRLRSHTILRAKSIQCLGDRENLGVMSRELS